MFESIIGYPQVVQRLSHALSEGRLARSIVLEGTPYSGRSTIALEIARSLMCKRTANADCDCSSCLQHRGLTHPDLFIFGPRNFLWDISGAERILESTGDLLFFRRSIRRITRRFDLQSGTKKEEYAKHLAAIEELLADFSPDHATKLIPHIKALIARHEGNITVETIRSIIKKSGYHPEGRARVVIFENFEKTNESSSNALLKLLEEPPPSFYIICTARSRTLLAPTIASRLYSYFLPPRTPEDQREAARQVLQRMDIDIPAFFRSSYVGKDTDDLARTLLKEPRKEDRFWTGYRALIEDRDEKTVFLSLMDSCASHISRQLLTASPHTILYLRSFWKKLAMMQHMVEVRHLSPQSALEGLYFE